MSDHGNLRIRNGSDKRMGMVFITKYRFLEITFRKQDGPEGMKITADCYVLSNRRSQQTFYAAQPNKTNI